MGERRHFKISHSWGVYDAYKAIRKQGWMDIGRCITEKQFYAIIRRLNEEIALQILQGRTVNLPKRLGQIEVSKMENITEMKDGKLRIRRPIDWNGTLRLWEEDAEAKKQKVLVRFNSKYTYKFRYSKFKATYDNKVFYCFTPMRELKLRLKEKINNKELDTLW